MHGPSVWVCRVLRVVELRNVSEEVLRESFLVVFVTKSLPENSHGLSVTEGSSPCGR